LRQQILRQSQVCIGVLCIDPDRPEQTGDRPITFV
jgi:hypothetical protein